jgi:hypothetical protein
MRYEICPGDLVWNLKTKENGKVIETYQDNGLVMRMVSVPKDPSGWSSGARVAHWSEDDLDFSTNDLLDESLGEGSYA